MVKKIIEYIFEDYIAMFVLIDYLTLVEQLMQM